MAILLLPFVVLAAIGFLLSAAAHVASLLGLPIPGGEQVMSLHIGVFVVWLPTMLVAMRANQGRPQSDIWKNVLSGCPPWMRYAGYVLFAYAIANFIWCAATGGTRPKTESGVSAFTVRMFSGHWLIFYGIAFAVLLSAYRNPRLLTKPVCSNGHDISATDLFCPTCGSKIQVPRTGR